jgi:spore cortex biosynthesis protein YabQ
MNAAILVELRFFGMSFYWGMFLLLIYDLLRILRRIVKHNNFFITVEDVIYWITDSVLIFRMMYQQNNGIIRGFSILAMLLGMLFYHAVFSEFLVRVISGIINKITAYIIKFINLLLTPFFFIFSRISRFFLWIKIKMRNMYHYFLNSLKNKRKSGKIAVSENEKGD